MTYEEATHSANVSILRNLIKRYGINRSLGNVLDNEESILKAVKKNNQHGHAMRKELKHRKGERLYEWIERISAYYDTHEVSTREMHEIMREVSVQSYIAGSNAMESITNGFMRR